MHQGICTYSARGGSWGRGRRLSVVSSWFIFLRRYPVHAVCRGSWLRCCAGWSALQSYAASPAVIFEAVVDALRWPRPAPPVDTPCRLRRVTRLCRAAAACMRSWADMDPLPLLVRPSTGRQPVRATILVATRITKKAPQVAAEAVRTGPVPQRSVTSRCTGSAVHRQAKELQPQTLSKLLHGQCPVANAVFQLRLQLGAAAAVLFNPEQRIIAKAVFTLHSVQDAAPPETFTDNRQWVLGMAYQCQCTDELRATLGIRYISQRGQQLAVVGRVIPAA